jgi:hypothetical protein
MPSIPRSAWKVMCLAIVIPCITAACALRAAPKGTASAVTASAVANDWTRVTQLPRRAKLKGWGTFGFLIGAIDGASETELVVLYAAAGGD